MSVLIRPARLDDIEAVVPYIQMAAGGISEFLLTDLVEGMSVAQLLEMALTDENTPYYYENIMVAEFDRKIVAASNFYPAEQHGLPDIMRSLIPAEKLQVIQPYLETKVDDSMYIHTLAVNPKYRRSTVGIVLGKKIEKIAKAQNKRCLSAHVWRDDSIIFNGLKISGFREVQKVPIPTNDFIPHKNGMVLLKGPDF